MYAPLDLRLVAMRFVAIPPEEYPLSVNSRRPFFTHRESAKAIVLAFAFLSVIPFGNLLLLLPLPLPLLFLPSFPSGICFSAVNLS
jgi:hypothetical protein